MRNKKIYFLFLVLVVMVVSAMFGSIRMMLRFIYGSFSFFLPHSFVVFFVESCKRIKDRGERQDTFILRLYFTTILWWEPVEIVAFLRQGVEIYESHFQ